MKRIFAGVLGALLVFGLVARSAPASAGGYSHGGGGRYHASCNCYGPVTQVVDAGTQVITSHHTYHTHQVVPHVRVVDRHRVILHRRTIVHRQIVTHRHHTHHRHLTVNRINTAHRFQTVHKHQLVKRRVNTYSRSHASKTVKGRDCQCAPGQKNFRGMKHWRKHAISSRH